jgi:hypothetical protein
MRKQMSSKQCWKLADDPRAGSEQPEAGRFHEIHIMPTSFLVRAKDSAGNPVGSIWKMPARRSTRAAADGEIT